MQRILIVNGSPRKKGNTATLLNAVIRGIESQGQFAETYSLAELAIHPCTGCGYCEQHGACIIEDDMTPLYRLIEQANKIVIGTPVYFYGVTAQTKAFIDRCQALWSKKYLLGWTPATQEHPLGYVISVAATDGGRVFDGVKLSIRYAFDAMNCLYTGELLIKGMDRSGAIAKHPEHLMAAETLGREIGTPR